MGNAFETTVSPSATGESTLSLNRTQLRRAVARYLGVSRNSADWASDPYLEEDINDIVASGERSFYQPVRLPNESSVHAWSFLRPVLPLPIVANTADYDLPDDFAGFIDPYLSFVAADDQWHSVELTNVVRIQRKRQTEDLAPSDEPELAAVNQKTVDQTGGQRYEIMLWPSPSTAATLTAPYYSNPFAITDAAPYPLGGQPHAETLLESVLAAAELHENDTRDIHRVTFQERLAASIALDRKLTTTKDFGYNGDSSMRPRIIERHQGNYVTYMDMLPNGA